MNQHQRITNIQSEPQGLFLQDALHRWTDPAAFERLERLQQTSLDGTSAGSDGAGLNGRLENTTLDAWRTLRTRIEMALLDRIRQGALVLTAYADPLRLGSLRQIVPPELIDELAFDFDDNSASAADFRLLHCKVHLPQPQLAPHEWWKGRPLGPMQSQVYGVDQSAPDLVPEFTHSADYGWVTIRGLVFDLSGGLCQIIACLHEASTTDDPWLNGKQLLWDCGYQTSFMGDAFKRHEMPSWRELIKGNGRGLYKLNLIAPSPSTLS